LGVPVTLIYAGLHGLLLVALSIQVLRYRVRADVKGPEVAQRMERAEHRSVFAAAHIGDRLVAEPRLH